MPFVHVFLLGIYLGITVYRAYLALVDNVKQFSKLVIPICILIDSV